MKNYLWWIPNSLSIMRCVLACCMVLCSHILWPIWIILALISDVLDGFLARRWGVTSKLGTILDPVGDKLFSYSCCWIFWYNQLVTKEAIYVLCARDIILILFAITLVIVQRWHQWEIQAFWCGKIFTALQWAFFFVISIGLSFDQSWYSTLFIVAVVGFFELLYRAYREEKVMP